MMAVSWYDVIRRKARAARRLSGADWGVFLQAWFLLLAVDVGLRLLPFRWVQGWAARAKPGRADLASEQVSGTLERLQRLVDVAARHHLYRMSCLRHALVLQRLLGRRGIRADLRFGVRREEAELRAHAWLEHAGQPIGAPGGVAGHYAPLVARETDG